MNIWQESFIRKQQNNRRRQCGVLFLLLMGIGIVVAVGLSLGLGSTALSLKQGLKAVWQGDTVSSAYRIFVYVRLPRTMAALLAGAGLAMSGVLIQAALHNALAGPNVIGVNAGAGFGVALASALFPGIPAVMPAAAFGGAVLTGMLILLFSVKSGAGRLTIVLAGVAISSILSAGIDGITALVPDLAINTAAFKVGGFTGVSFAKLFPAGWYIVAGMIVAFLVSADLNVLTLGDETAKSLGMHVTAVRIVILVLASALAGAAISFSGLLGFVGLLVPHAMRRILGTDHRMLLPASAMAGSIFVLLCDVAGRVMFAPFEIPVGIIMSLIGGPFFLVLLLKNRRENA